MDRIWLPSVVLIATIVVVALTYAMRPEQRALARRGARYALWAALIVGLVLVVLATMLFLGLSGLSDSSEKNLADPFIFGVIAGAVLAGGYFCLNLIVLEIGLWFRPSEGWAKGAAFATPVVLAALGFGWAIYKAYPV